MINFLFNTKYGAFLCSRRFILGLLGLGIFLRIYYFLTNPSIYSDEACYVMSDYYRSFGDIIAGTGADHMPIGFHLLVKLSLFLFGLGEYGLRLAPLLFSVFGLFAFFRLLNRHETTEIVPIALSFFALSESLIYYAAEVKSYPQDLFVTLIILTFSLRSISKTLSWSNILSYGLCGGLLIWFSYSSCFVMAGSGIALFIISAIKRRLKEIPKLFCVFLFWLASFAVLYFTAVSKANSNPHLSYYWQNYWVNDPFSFAGGLHFFRSVVSCFENPFGLSFPVIGFAFFLLGIFSTARKSVGELLIYSLPIVITAVLYLLKIYPLSGRTVIFLLPFFIILTSRGILYLLTRKSRLLQITALLSLIILILKPAGKAADGVIHPYLKNDIRPAVEELISHYEAGDKICITNSSQWAVWYYFTKYGFEYNGSVLTVVADETKIKDGKPYTKILNKSWRTDNNGNFSEIRDLNSIQEVHLRTPTVFPQGNRVWVLFSWHKQGLDDFVLKHLELNGTRLDQFETDGSSLYLYDLGK